jgi:ribosomal protein L11 methyltransferase
MIGLFPAGFGEWEVGQELELVAYGDEVAAERLAKALGPVRAEPIEAGWEVRWRRFHRAVRIGPLWVGPPWERPEADAVAIVIDPGRAFGTGGHATTRLCLELLVDLRSELRGGGVLDVGCGSGVLAIAAARLGYWPVCAVDLDPAAVDETRRNAQRNGVEVEVRLADALAAELPVADLVVANIARPTVDALAARLRCRVLAASGYLDSEPVPLAGLRHRERRGADGWAADLYELGELSVRNRDSGVT